MDFAEQKRRPEQLFTPKQKRVSAEGSEDTAKTLGNGVDYSKVPKALRNTPIFGVPIAPPQAKAQVQSHESVPDPKNPDGHIYQTGTPDAKKADPQQPDSKIAQPKSTQPQSGFPSEGVKVASTGQMRLDPGETDSQSIPVRKPSLTPEQQLHRKFETDVAAHAQGLLKANKDRLNSEQTQYAQDKNPNSDRWQKLWQAADQRREFQRKEATAQTNYDYANQQIEALMASPNDFNPMASAEQRRKDAQQKATLIADYKHLRAVSQTQIEQARQNQVTLTYVYPALAAVQDESGNNPKDIQTVQSRIPGEFDGIRGNIDKLSAEMVKDPTVGTLFDSVVQQSLHQVPREQRPQVMTWLKTQRENQERNTQIGALASGGLMLASLFPVGRLTATGLRMVGIGLGGGVAAAQMPDLMLLDTAAQAGRGGMPLANQSPEQAKFNLVMGYANVGLAGLDVGLETGAVQKLAGVSGELAATGVQISRQKWSQAMEWVKQGPTGIERARAFFASMGIPREKAAETIQTIQDGFSKIWKRSAPEVETVGVPSQSAVKTTEENIKDAKALQSKGSGSGEYKKPKIIADLEKLPNAKLFAPNQLEHVIFGNQNKAGKFTGWHHFPSRRPGEDVRLANDLSLNELEKDSHGVYRATVEASFDGRKTWVQKTAKDQTFFPDKWSRERVVDEIVSALKEGRIKNEPGTSSDSFRGISKSGVEIRGYLDSNGQIMTAYPVFEP
jgi:Bacterial EndoU nuclease